MTSGRQHVLGWSTHGIEFVWSKKGLRRRPMPLT